MQSDFDLRNIPQEKVRKSENRKSRKIKPDKAEVHGTVLPSTHSAESKELDKGYENPIWLDAVDEMRKEFSEK